MAVFFFRNNESTGQSRNFSDFINSINGTIFSLIATAPLLCHGVHLKLTLDDGKSICPSVIIGQKVFGRWRSFSGIIFSIGNSRGDREPSPSARSLPFSIKRVSTANMYDETGGQKQKDRPLKPGAHHEPAPGACRCLHRVSCIVPILLFFFPKTYKNIGF